MFDCGLFCISPGLRSAPLIIAIATKLPTQTIVCHDERSLCFAALGHAKATQKASVVIVTSGTAVANLFPAVIEAYIDEVPLILLTADRPAEYRGLEMNQTIDQVKIFSAYTHYFLDVFTDQKLNEQIKHGLKFVFNPTPGPIQINCQFREPIS